MSIRAVLWSCLLGCASASGPPPTAPTQIHATRDTRRSASPSTESTDGDRAPSEAPKPTTAATEAPDPLESADILARAPETGPVEVRHIVISWRGIDPTKDALAAQPTKAESDALASELLAKIRSGADIVPLMKEHSEDPGSAYSGKAYTVDKDSAMVEPFKNLSLRLHVGEVGLVKSRYGWHIIKRLPPPPPDPLESVAIMNRAKVAESVKVKHILLGWKQVHSEDPRGVKRTRKQLVRLVKTTVTQARKKGASFEKLMKKLSEDPGSARTGEAYTASPESGMVKPFLNLSLRLEPGEIGVVKTEYGMHIIKRVE